VYSKEEVALVRALHAEGFNHSQIARRVGISRATVRGWLAGRTPDFERRRATCNVCAGQPATLPQAPYTYLLGLYLGDGCLASCPRGVYRLRIACANAYPELLQRCEAAIPQVLPVKVGRVRYKGHTEVYAYSKHWVCLFPQHGPGVKHKRKIELTVWQQELIDRDARHLLRGLLHSDGCRVNNWVNGTLYPRYEFTNVSADIQAIFGRACDAIGIEWRPNKPDNLSVARRRSVALLDEFVGPKR
jgi:transcriptional regulator with XRE-family HTH domain